MMYQEVAEDVPGGGGEYALGCTLRLLRAYLEIFNCLDVVKGKPGGLPGGWGGGIWGLG